MNMIEQFQIKTMNRSELNFAIELAANEGWNPGLYDADPFYSADHEGFLIGLLNNKPIACISAVSYENKFGFIGFYIVVPEYRGKGYGIKIWNAAIEKLKNHNIALDGVFAQQDNYRKSGFKFAYSNIRYEWKNTYRKFDKRSMFNGATYPFEKICEYDKTFFPADRKSFLQNWLSMPESYSTVHMMQNQVMGYGVIRKCRLGYKIGPLFADTNETAENIFLSLTNQVEENVPIYLDVPEVNLSAMNLAEKYNMKSVFGTARMYTGEFPNISVERTYGVTTFELG
jgi:GNAT superfamily N-acetyltransferase